jgi:hypothetical protein
MEQFQESRQNAIRKLSVADHMLTMTYPLVQDPKLLLAVLENVFSAMENAMSSVLHYERLFKRIPAFQDSFESKLTVFKSRVQPKYKINEEYINLLYELREIIVEHKRSPVEFARKDKFVICSDNYKMKAISVPEIKKYIAKAKLFVQTAGFIVSKNEGIFRSS